MVLDEWPDATSFHTFFQGTQAEIGPLMMAAGAQGEPEIGIWRELDTPDRWSRVGRA